MGRAEASGDGEQEQFTVDSAGQEHQAAVGAVHPFYSTTLRFFRERLQAGSIKGSVFTLMVAIVGAGTLSVPYAVYETGLLLGMFLFFAGAVLAYFTMGLLIHAALITNSRSYRAMALRLSGPTGAFITQASLMLNLWGTMIAYLVAAGHVMSLTLRVIFGIDTADSDVPAIVTPGPLMFALTATTIAPLALLRSVSALRYSHFFAVATACYVAVVMTILYFSFCATHQRVREPNPDGGFFEFGDSHNVMCFWESPAEPGGGGELPKYNETSFVLADFDPGRILTSVPIVVFAYTCHPNVLPVFLELQRPTEKRMLGKVVYRAVFASLLLYLLIGGFGYLTFQEQLDKSKGNFLLNDYHRNPAMIIGAVGYSLYLVMAIPLFVHSFRASVWEMLFPDLQSAADVPARWHIGVTLAVLGLALVPGVLVGDISKVFVILGATTNPLICFIIPAYLFWKCASDEEHFVEKRLGAAVAVVMSLLSLATLVHAASSW